jgi:hypothetical protein
VVGFFNLGHQEGCCRLSGSVKFHPIWQQLLILKAIANRKYIAARNPLDYNHRMLNTIAELPAYHSYAEKHLSLEERQAVIDYLAEHPKAGDLMRGTGGIRKLRWGKGGRGKSGGVRIIYYFHDERIPLYLLTLFAKNEQANLTADERNTLASLVDILVTTALENN